MNGIAFDVADRTTAEDKAIEAAITEAKRRGRLMADAAGVTLGQDAVGARIDRRRPDPDVRAPGGRRAPTPVMPGEQAVTANASITWEIAEE